MAENTSQKDGITTGFVFAGILYNGAEILEASAAMMYEILNNPNRFTLTPRTRRVHGFIVPSPIDIEPAAGVRYYIAATSSGNLVNSAQWSGSGYCESMLSRGVLFTTLEAAQQNALAMIGRDPAKGVEGV